MLAEPTSMCTSPGADRRCDTALFVVIGKEHEDPFLRLQSFAPVFADQREEGSQLPHLGRVQEAGPRIELEEFVHSYRIDAGIAAEDGGLEVIFQ